MFFVLSGILITHLLLTEWNRKTQAVFNCMRYGHCENADLNAAKTILAVGHTVLACGDIGQDAA
jgi:transposase